MRDERSSFADSDALAGLADGFGPSGRGGFLLHGLGVAGWSFRAVHCIGGGCILGGSFFDW